MKTNVLRAAVGLIALGGVGVLPRPSGAVQRVELRICNDWHSIVRLRLNNEDRYPFPAGQCVALAVRPGPNVLFPLPYLLRGDWFASDAWVVDVPRTGATARFGALRPSSMLELLRVETPKGAALAFQRCDWPNRVSAAARVPYLNTFYWPDIGREEVLRWVGSALVCERRPSR